MQLEWLLFDCSSNYTLSKPNNNKKNKINREQKNGESKRIKSSYIN